MNRPIVVCLLALSAALAVSACGPTLIDHKKNEAAINDQLKSNGVAVRSVSCPKDVKAEAGTSFKCGVVVKNGDKYLLQMKTTDSKGTIEPVGSLTRANP